MKPKIEHVHGQESWFLESGLVELSVTRHGGMIGPAHFALEGGKRVQPFYLTPWQGDGRSFDDPVLNPLRGDFFCMPFGADNEYEGEHHVTHGEPATAEWHFDSLEKNEGVTRFEASLEMQERKGRVNKRIILNDAHPVIYTEHELSGFSGKMSLGHHAILDPAEGEGGLRIATSPIGLGVTRPFDPSFNLGGEYCSLAPQTTFDDLKRVPTIWKDPGTSDCTVFPARRGYCDIVAVYADRSTGHESRFAWTAAVAPERGYLWFSLKDPATLPATVMWLENHGRNADPWNARTCCIGLEDVCAYIAEGLRPSAADNVASRAGYPTHASLSPDTPHTVRYLQGVAPVSSRFDRVADISVGTDSIELRAESGESVSVAVRPEFLRDGKV